MTVKIFSTTGESVGDGVSLPPAGGGGQGWGLNTGVLMSIQDYFEQPDFIINRKLQEIYPGWKITHIKS